MIKLQWHRKNKGIIRISGVTDYYYLVSYVFRVCECEYALCFIVCHFIMHTEPNLNANACTRFYEKGLSCLSRLLLFIVVFVCARRILHSTKKGFTKRSFCIIDDNLHFSYLFSNKLHGKCAGS